MKNSSSTNRSNFTMIGRHFLFALWLVLFCVKPCLLSAQEQENKSASKDKSGLDSITFAFDVAVQELAKPLIQLQNQYEGNLQSLQKKAERAGDLESLLEIKAAMETFRSGLVSPARHSSELKRSQAVYSLEINRRRRNFQRDVRPALRNYHKKLEALESRLTTLGRVEEAVKVRDKKNEIQKLLDSDLSRAAIELGILSPGIDSPNEATVVVFPDNKTAVTEIGVVKVNVPAATNRPYYLTEIPEELEGLSFLKMELREDVGYSYKVSGNCNLYALVHKDSMKRVSGTTIDKKWKKTDFVIQASGGFFYVFQKKHKKGTYQMDSMKPWAALLASKGEISVKK